MNRRQFLRNAAGAAVATRLPAAPAAPVLTAQDIRSAAQSLAAANILSPHDLYPGMVSYKVMFTLGVLPELTQMQRVQNAVIAGHLDYLKVGDGV